MPTGYTAVITDEMPFSEWAMIAVRAMGVCVMMRDEPFDAPIPEAFAPHDYHSRRLDEIGAERDRLAALTEAECVAEQAAEIAEETARRAASDRERELLRNRYERMLAAVEAWEPPTPEYIGFQRFMREQLTESIRVDCSVYEREWLEVLPAAEWREAKLARLADDYRYHLEHHEAEVRRTNERNVWLAAFRKSLPKD